VIPSSFNQTDVRALAGHVEATVLTVLIALLVWRLGIAAIDRFYARRFVSRFIPRVSTFCTLSKSTMGLIVLVIAALELLNIWEVNVTPAVWSAGFITAALAFGSQAIVRDVVTGFFYLFEDQYDVGDRIELVTSTGQTITGTIETIGFRTTKVIDRRGRMVVVPNGNIALVTNSSRLPTAVGFTIAVPWRDSAIAMRERIGRYAEDAAQRCGAEAQQTKVTLTDSTPEQGVFRVEFRSAQSEAELENSNVREDLVARLQSDGWLPSGAQSPKDAD
jgi:small-conductance mechanosensitive channel